MSDGGPKGWRDNQGSGQSRSGSLTGGGSFLKPGNHTMKFIMFEQAMACNWLKDLFVPFGSAIIGGGLALLGSWLTIRSNNAQFINKLKTEREIDRNNALLGLKIEIDENLWL